MKTKYCLLIITSTLLALGTLSYLYSEGELVQKRNFFVVPHHHREPIDLAVGDMVQLNTRNLPLTQNTINATYRVSYNEEYVRLIASTPPDVEGPMTREVYVKCVKSGTTEVRVTVFDAKSIVEEYPFLLNIK